MAITYLEGDATTPIGDGTKIIAHVCNDKMLWGRGFVLAIDKRWSMPKRVYTTWQSRVNPDGTPRVPHDVSLGSVQLVAVEIHPDKSQPDIWVANMIGQHDIVAKDGVPPVRYDAIRTALQFVAQDAKQLKASVHMPYIGCGLAGGDWKIVRKIVEETLTDITVFIYQYTDNRSRSFVPAK